MKTKEGLDSLNTSLKRKRLLFVSLFIVPFLAGMALIFWGKGIASLPILHPVGQDTVEGKTITTYYKVPNFSFKDLEGGTVEFLDTDSSLFLLTLFQQSQQAEWEKHMMYHTKIIQRYSNAKIFTIYEGDSTTFNWSENPVPYFNRYPKWTAGQMNSSEFNQLARNLYLEVDSVSGIYPYVIIDKEKHIRAYCSINDLKASRDVPKMFKILHNQYAPRRAKITQKQD